MQCVLITSYGWYVAVPMNAPVRPFHLLASPLVPARIRSLLHHEGLPNLVSAKSRDFVPFFLRFMRFKCVMRVTRARERAERVERERKEFKAKLLQSILRQDPRSRPPGVSRVAVIGWMLSTLHVLRPTSIHSAPRAGGLASPTFIWVVSLLRTARVNVFTNARGC